MTKAAQMVLENWILPLSAHEELGDTRLSKVFAKGNVPQC